MKFASAETFLGCNWDEESMPVVAKLRLRTAGCSCCSHEQETSTPATAVELLTDYIADLEHEVDKALKLRDLIEETKAIPVED